MDRTQTLDRFLADWSRRRRFWRALVAVCVWGAPLLLLAMAVGLVMPAWSVVVDASAVGLVGLVMIREILRTRPDGRRVDRDYGLGDRMRTLLEARERPAPPGLLAWLEREVATRLADPARAARRRPARLGPLRWAAWALLLALMVKLLAFAAPPGSLQLASAAGGGGARSGPQGDPNPSAGGGQSPSVGESTAEARPDPTSREDQPEPDPVEEEPFDEGAPEALLDDLPEQPDFVAPQFIGDGATDTVTAPTAALDEAPAAAGGPQSVARRAAGGGSEEPEEPEPRIDFARAREEALRARHVREEERAFVRAWFDRLVESERHR